MSTERAFRALVAQALDQVPSSFQDALIQVEVVVEDCPSPATRTALGLQAGEGLYGLYEGTPLPERSPDLPELPSRITIYRLPLCEDFPDPQTLREEVIRTLLHELAHHVGLDDERLETLGWD